MISQPYASQAHRMSTPLYPHAQPVIRTGPLPSSDPMTSPSSQWAGRPVDDPVIRRGHYAAMISAVVMTDR